VGALVVLVAVQLSVLGLYLTFLSQNLRLKRRLDRLDVGAKRDSDYVTRRFDASSARLNKPVGLDLGRNTA
jgi:hypothetical protein